MRNSDWSSDVCSSDLADNIGRIRQVIARIDRDTAATTTVVLKNAGAREIATSLQALVTTGGEGAAKPATVVPIDSSNAVAIRGDAGTVARLAQMARDLDRQAASGTEIRVYWLEHADAEKLLPVLQQLVGQATASPVTASTPAAGTPPSAAPAAASTVVAGSGGSGGNGISSRGPALVPRRSEEHT